MQQLDLCSRQAQEREAAYQETRTVRHDLKNYLLEIKFLLAEGKTEEVKGRVDRILEKNDMDKAGVAKTGNLVLDSLINYRYAVAQSQHIPMQCRIELPGELPFDGADLSIILGNVLDNAMEAVKKLPREQRYIQLFMRLFKGSLTILVVNPFEGNIIKGSGGRLLTSKEDKKNHGIGLTSVSHVAKKYKGELLTSYEKNLFCAEVILYPRQVSI